MGKGVWKMKFMVGSQKFEAETTYDAFKVAEKIMLEKGWKELRVMMYSVVSEGWESLGRVIVPEAQKNEEENKEKLITYKQQLLTAMDIVKMNIERNFQGTEKGREYYNANAVAAIARNLAEEAKELARLEGQLHVVNALLDQK